MNMFRGNSRQEAQIPKNGHLPKAQQICLWKVCDTMFFLYIYYFGIYIYTAIVDFRIFLLL